ncbi:MAG: methyltransferase domain-containing protein [Armatimonadota bacterium]
MATTLAGLEEVLAEEARERLSPSGLRALPGRIVFDRRGPAQEAASLRCAEEVWAYVREVAVPVAGARSLRQWRAKLRRTEFESGLRTVRRAGGSEAPTTMRVSVAAAPDVKVRFIDLQSSAAAALGAASGLQPSGAEADVWVRVLVEPECTTIGLALPRAEGFGPAASPWRPVAAAMLRMAQVQPGGTIADLACGEGVLLSEWGAAGGRGTYVAGDGRRREVVAARAAAHAAEVRARFAVWRVRALPLRDGAVRACLGLVRRLPRDRRRVAAELWAEVARVLARGGRAVLAAERGLGLRREAQKHALAVARALRVRVERADLELLAVERT